MEFKRSLVDTGPKLSRLLEKLGNAPEHGFDTESNGPLLVGLRGKKSMVNVYRSRLAGMSFAFDDGTSYYVPLEHRQGNLPAYEHRRLANAVDCERTAWIHNAKHEYKALARWEPWLDIMADGENGGWRCTQVGCWLAGRESRAEKSPYALKELAPTYLGIDMSSFDDTTGGMDFGQLLPKDGLDYACEDAEAALRLGREVVTPRLREWGLEDWYRDVEMPFLFLLREMEDAGMALDRERHGRIIEGLEGTARELAERWEFLTDVSITSPKQLGTLYEQGIWDPAGVPRKATGPSTEAEYVRWQLDRCPPGSLGHRLASIKLDHAQVTKLAGTYGRKLVDLADQYPDGRLHTNFLQTGTATGRLSSSYPNLQNIPKRTDLGKRIREAFVPAPGHVYLSADYSQIELRIMAHFAGSGRLLDGYRAGTDVHQETADLASSLLNLPFTRDQGKTGNFAPIYGAGPKRAAKTLGITVEQAKAFLDAHAEIHSEVHGMLDRARRAGLERGYVRTLAGRRRSVDIARYRALLDAYHDQGLRYKTSEKYRDAWYRLGKEERRARNTPIQGGAADVVKVGMLAARRSVPGKMVCQIHDDIVYEVPEGRATEAAEALKQALEGAGKRFALRVPLVAEPALGARWSEI